MPYNKHNRRKCSLRVHLVLVTKYRKKLLRGELADNVKQKVYDYCNIKGHDLLAMETDLDHIHILLVYDATDRVSDIVKGIKQITTHYLWNKYHNLLDAQYWKKRIFWSDGYFACSVGDASTETIQNYIKSQG